MEYGHFDDSHREYVITRPDTPLPWLNYLGCEDFFGLISNTAGGYCFYRDARLRRLLRYRYNNVPLDSNGRYLYVKDGGAIWNPSWKPTRAALDHYECRHGLGYSVIRGAKDGECVIGTFDLSNTTEFRRWILGFGRHAVVLAPTSLAEDLRVEICAACTAYGQEHSGLGLASRPKVVCRRKGANHAARLGW